MILSMNQKILKKYFTLQKKIKLKKDGSDVLHDEKIENHDKKGLPGYGDDGKKLFGLKKQLTTHLKIIQML